MMICPRRYYQMQHMPPLSLSALEIQPHRSRSFMSLRRVRYQNMSILFRAIWIVVALLTDLATCIREYAMLIEAILHIVLEITWGQLQEHGLFL
eukprot:2555703-Karenia_brevis.AAC.1